jgi:hypothetical protein
LPFSCVTATFITSVLLVVGLKGIFVMWLAVTLNCLKHYYYVHQTCFSRKYSLIEVTKSMLAEPTLQIHHCVCCLVHDNWLTVLHHQDFDIASLRLSIFSRYLRDGGNSSATWAHMSVSPRRY